MGTYRTVAGRSRYAPEPTKGSRFVATVAPAKTDAEALGVVAELEAEQPDATHHCWAYRLRDRARSSDAGEPGGSAGRPILAQLEGHGLVEVVVVVSRWFGGTKLGVGGLVRAYGAAAGQALDRAEIAVVVETTRLAFAHDYGDTSGVEAVLGAERLARLETTWGEEVSVVVEVPTDEVGRIRALLRDRTSGRVRFPDR